MMQMKTAPDHLRIKVRVRRCCLSSSHRISLARSRCCRSRLMRWRSKMKRSISRVQMKRREMINKRMMVRIRTQPKAVRMICSKRTRLWRRKNSWVALMISLPHGTPFPFLSAPQARKRKRVPVLPSKFRSWRIRLMHRPKSPSKRILSAVAS